MTKRHFLQIKLDESNCTIQLGGTQLPRIIAPLTVDGVNPTSLIVRGTPTTRIFEVCDTDFTLLNITIKNGEAANGGRQRRARRVRQLSF